MENNHKKCTKCEKEYPATLKYFFKHKSGLEPSCKKCKQAKVMQHYHSNRETYQETFKRWVKNNPETDLKKRQEQWEKIPAGVYGIKNIVNGKMYIGESKKPNQRWYTHRTDLKLQKHPNKKLQNDFNQYGNVFVYGIIEFCDDKIKRLELEKQYQKQYAGYTFLS